MFQAIVDHQHFDDKRWPLKTASDEPTCVLDQFGGRVFDGDRRGSPNP
jgi:hypothetical protein